MKFEDIVDMEWLNSNSGSAESLPSSPSAGFKEESADSFSPDLSHYYDPYGFNDHIFFWEQNFTNADTDMKNVAPWSAASSSCQNQIPSGPCAQGAESSSSQMAGIEKAQELTPATIEYIKQVIEAAKLRLAMQEQQRRQGSSANADQTKPPEELPTAMLMHPILNSFNQSPIPSVPDTIAPETLMKQPHQTEGTSPASESKSCTNQHAKRRESSASLNAGAEELMTLEEYAKSDGIDIKSLTPKERRQLRNKISARNFRVRRKGRSTREKHVNEGLLKLLFSLHTEYINTLEAQVDEQKKKVEQLQTRLTSVEEENEHLRREVDTLRRQNQILMQQQQKAAPSPSSSSSNDLSRSPSSPRVSSPIPKPNLNKDISLLGSKASETYRQDTRILVSNAVIPAWDFERIFTVSVQDDKQSLPVPAADSQAIKIAGYILEMFVRFAHTTKSDNAQQEKGDEDASDDHWVAPLLPDDRDFSSYDDVLDKSTVLGSRSPSSQAEQVSFAQMEYLYDTLIMSALTMNVQTGSYETDKSFWWWDSSCEYDF